MRLERTDEKSGRSAAGPISGARTPHGLGSDDSEMESASRNLGGSRRLSRARDNIEPPGGAVLKCEGSDPQHTARSEPGSVPVRAPPICSMKLTSLPAVATPLRFAPWSRAGTEKHCSRPRVGVHLISRPRSAANLLRATHNATTIK